MGYYSKLHFNPLGSVTSLTDSTGELVFRYDYDVYGAPSGYSAAGNPAGFYERPYVNAFFTVRERAEPPQSSSERAHHTTSLWVCSNLLFVVYATCISPAPDFPI